MVSRGIKGKRQKAKAIHTVLILVLVIFGLVAFFSSNKKTMERQIPSISLEAILRPFFKEIPTVKWVVYDSRRVYVGFEANFDPERPDPLKMITGNAARQAADAGYRSIELWAVDASCADRSWRPENGIEAWLLTTITRSGYIIHTQ